MEQYSVTTDDGSYTLTDDFVISITIKTYPVPPIEG